MPSMKCHQCGKVKRCQMVVTDDHECETCDDMRSRCTGDVPRIEYLCKPCRRELGR